MERTRIEELEAEVARLRAEVLRLQKERGDLWYRVLEYRQDDELTAEVKVEEEDRPIMIRARIYDKHGIQTLLFASLSMENMPRSKIRELHNLLSAQNIGPTLVLADKVKFVRLQAMTAAEARQEVDQTRRIQLAK